MKKSERINRVRDISGRKEQMMAREMGLKLNKRQAEVDRLNDLLQYRKEYSSQFRTNCAEGMPAKQLCEYRNFLGQMDIAIQQQEQAVDHAEHELLVSRSAWLKANQKLSSFGKLVDKFSAAESLRQSNQEQTEIDDRPKRG